MKVPADDNAPSTSQMQPTVFAAEEGKINSLTVDDLVVIKSSFECEFYVRYAVLDYR